MNPSFYPHFSENMDPNHCTFIVSELLIISGSHSHVHSVKQHMSSQTIQPFFAPLFCQKNVNIAFLVLIKVNYAPVSITAWKAAVESGTLGMGDNWGQNSMHHRVTIPGGQRDVACERCTSCPPIFLAPTSLWRLFCSVWRQEYLSDMFTQTLETMIRVITKVII